MKMKDFVLLALLTALYMIAYLISMMVISLMGPFGHAISPGICGLLSGAIIFFITRKIGKMWQFTILELIEMGVFALMGAGYLPWLISSMVGAVLADILVSRSSKPSVWKVAVASGLIHVGNALGGIIPATFFADRKRANGRTNGGNGQIYTRYNGTFRSGNYICAFVTWRIYRLHDFEGTFERGLNGN